MSEEKRPFTAGSFYAYLGEGKLMASDCRSCAALSVPPKPLCGRCGFQEQEWRELSGRGVVAAFTAIAVVPSSMAERGYGRENPYCSGVVQLDEGPRVPARIEGLDARAPSASFIGMPATFEPGDADETAAGVKFRVRHTAAG